MGRQIILLINPCSSIIFSPSFWWVRVKNTHTLDTSQFLFHFLSLTKWGKLNIFNHFSQFEFLSTHFASPTKQSLKEILEAPHYKIKYIWSYYCRFTFLLRHIWHILCLTPLLMLSPET